MRILLGSQEFANRFVKIYNQSAERMCNIVKTKPQEEEKYAEWEVAPKPNQWHKEIREKMGFVIVPARRNDERNGLDSNAIMTLYEILSENEKRAVPTTKPKP